MKTLLDGLDLATENFHVEKVQAYLCSAPTKYVSTSKLCDLLLIEKKEEFEDTFSLHYKFLKF